MSFKIEEDKEITKHKSGITSNDRAVYFNQQPLTIWMTGLSAAGKSTLAFALEFELHQRGFKSYVLDGDNVRHGINKDLGFSHHDRSENVRRIAEIAHLMNDAGLVVICALISPFVADRLIAKEIIGKERFIEVYVNTPMSTCEVRDPKSLYRKARAGGLLDFTGVDSHYEHPQNPDCSIDTSNLSLDINIKILLEAILPKISLKKSAV